MSTNTPSKRSDLPGRGRPKRHSDDVLRTRLLDAAMTAFIEKGFARATTTDIARRAGMSKRDLYRLFDDKTQIFTETILSRRHLILDLPRPANEALAPLEALRCIFRLDLADREAAERDALMNLIARESLLFPDLNALLYDTGTIRSREFLITWLDGQMDAGSLPRCDTTRLAGLLMDVVFGALLPRRQHRGPVDRVAQSQEIMARIEIVLRGLDLTHDKERTSD
ncbi:Solvent efflux pump srpABC operon corepressor (plasmid) [Marinibacterium anthonyi]|nr:Solvent efflux pump srpABC operon corepressor [Marinibacterium anthonyi]